MEGNEVEKAAEEYAIDSAARTVAKFSFKAGANWKTERENAELQETRDAWKKDRDLLQVKRLEAEKELTRTSKELDDMTTKYNELSRKYDDLYRKNKSI